MAQKKRICADRESNPGQMLGRHLCYHYTIGAMCYTCCYTAGCTKMSVGSKYKDINEDNWQDLGRMNVSGRESILPDINCASEVNSATHLALVPPDLRTINSVRERGLLRSNHRMQLQIRVITRHSTIDSQKDFLKIHV
eukprot:scaffold4732_cov100-Skeletonema_marinoi.AAC.7